MSREVECPSCALQIDGEDEVCPYCGYERPRDRSVWKLVALVVALLLIWPLIQLIRFLF